MPKGKYMKIIIVTTEKEGIKETGFGDVAACLAVKKALRKGINGVRISLCARENDLEIVAKNSPDIIVLAAKYLQNGKGDKIWFSEYFEKININFTGSKREGLGLSSDKIWAKEAILNNGISTAPYITVEKDKIPLEKEIGISFPVFLKPLDAANGNGIDDQSIVYDYDAFKNKATQLFQKYGKKILAEKFLCGREFTVAVIEDSENHTYIVSPIEVIAPLNKDGNRILGENVKKTNVEQLVSINDGFLKRSLIKIALKCFKSLKARDFARIDIRQDENNEFHFIEANLVPGMTEGSSYFPKAFEVDKGITYTEVVALMMKNAMSRVCADKRNAQ